MRASLPNGRASTLQRPTRAYLAEVLAMVEATSLRNARSSRLSEAVLPEGGTPYREKDFEGRDQGRAERGRADGASLEVNTTRGRILCPDITVVRWWREWGARLCSYASDAHDPDKIAAGFLVATQMVEAAGFQAGPRPGSPYGAADPQALVARPWRRGRARDDGKVWLVNYALPGEVVEAEPRGRQGGVAVAAATRVIEASPHRVVAPCPYFGACGGCQLQHAAYQHQLELSARWSREAWSRAGLASASRHRGARHGRPLAVSDPR